MSSNLDFLADGGEMGRRMREKDWVATPLGAPMGWPQALRTAVRLLPNTGHPMYIFWGPDALCFYNDAYAPRSGRSATPRRSASPGRAVWAET